MARGARIEWLKNGALVLGSLAFTLLLAEGLLHILPVRDSPKLLPVTADAPVPRLTANRDVTWSRDWNFSIVSTRHVNNYGFVDDQDYAPDDPRPLLAVIGDSFVNSWMVPYTDSIQGRLAAAVADKRVYSFATPGAQLSTYLVFAAYARDTFRPDAAVFVVISNDFDESLLSYKREPKLTYFTEGAGGQLGELVTLPYRPSLATRVFRTSALARYLKLNSNVVGAGMALLRPGKVKYVANVASDTGQEKVADSQRVVDTFLDRVPGSVGLPRGRIAFVVDGLRQRVYGELSAQEAADSYADKMRRYFIATARARGFEVIDMQDAFAAHFRANGERFDFPTDAHWNSLGHEVAAQATMRSRVFTAFQDSDAQDAAKPLQ